jgi:hypothetical protein
VTRRINATLLALFVSAAVALPGHAPWFKRAGGHHVAVNSARLYDGDLLEVRFDLENYSPRERAWTFAHDDGLAALQIRVDGEWANRAAGSAGEGGLRVVGFGPVEPASIAVRVVHRGVASSPRLIEAAGPPAT